MMLNKDLDLKQITFSKNNKCFNINSINNNKISKIKGFNKNRSRKTSLFSSSNNNKNCKIKIKVLIRNNTCNVQLIL